ncbi:MAG: metal-dependent hydrolase [Vicinamibacterales bacterium]
MFIFGHLGVGRKLAQPWSRSLPTIPLLLGMLLPDIIDKPLYYAEVADIFSCTRTFGHTLALALVFLLVGLGSGKRAFTAIALGMTTHVVLDCLVEGPGKDLWSSSWIAAWWPFFGWKFSRVHFTVSEHVGRLIVWPTLIGEAVGLALLGWDFRRRRAR